MFGSPCFQMTFPPPAIGWHRKSSSLNSRLISILISRRCQRSRRIRRNTNSRKESIVERALEFPASNSSSISNNSGSPSVYNSNHFTTWTVPSWIYVVPHKSLEYIRPWTRYSWALGCVNLSPKEVDITDSFLLFYSNQREKGLVDKSKQITWDQVDCYGGITDETTL